MKKSNNQIHLKIILPKQGLTFIKNNHPNLN
jgi:hypothetical protein